MKLTQDEKLLIDELRNLSRLNCSEVNDFLKSLMYITILNFAEGESTKIPYFGELQIEYLGDKTTSEGRIADLNVKFIPANSLIKNIGQLVDVQNPKCDMKITDIDCIKDIIKDISSKLNTIMEDK